MHTRTRTGARSGHERTEDPRSAPGLQQDLHPEVMRAAATAAARESRANCRVKSRPVHSTHTVQAV